MNDAERRVGGGPLEAGGPHSHVPTHRRPFGRPHAMAVRREIAALHPQRDCERIVQPHIRMRPNRQGECRPQEYFPKDRNADQQSMAWASGPTVISDWGRS